MDVLRELVERFIELDGMVDVAQCTSTVVMPSACGASRFIGMSSNIAASAGHPVKASHTVEGFGVGLGDVVGSGDVGDVVEEIGNPSSPPRAPACRREPLVKTSLRPGRCSIPFAARGRGHRRRSTSRTQSRTLQVPFVHLHQTRERGAELGAAALLHMPGEAVRHAQLRRNELGDALGRPRRRGCIRPDRACCRGQRPTWCSPAEKPRLPRFRSVASPAWRQAKEPSYSSRA